MNLYKKYGIKTLDEFVDEENEKIVNSKFIKSRVSGKIKLPKGDPLTVDSGNTFKVKWYNEETELFGIERYGILYEVTYEIIDRCFMVYSKK